MVSKLLSSVSLLQSLSYRKKITFLSSLVLVISLPILIVVLSQSQNLMSKADTAAIVEPESGILSGNVVIKSSDNVSGGKYAVFAPPSVTPQPPTPTTFKAPTAIPTPWPPTPTWHPIATATPHPIATATPHPTLRPTVTPTQRPRPTSMPTPTPTPKHGNGNGNGN